MRKMNPVALKTSFNANLNNLLAFYAATEPLLTLDSQRSFLVENSLLAAAIQWEGFISDLLVAYINRDSTRFATHLHDALEEGLTEKQKTMLQRYCKLSVPKHLKKADIEVLVDGRGNNVTFSNFSALADQAKRWLVQADADRFVQRSAREKAVVNALITARNHLAHQSDRSHRAMNDALAAGALNSTGLRRGQKNIDHVGAYLKAKVTANNISRFEVFVNELSNVAGAL